MHQRYELPINNKSNILYISKTKIENEFSPSSHRHPNLEIILITNNFGYININNKKIKVEKGDLITINKNVEHFESKNELEFYAIGLNKYEISNKKIIEDSIFVINLFAQKYELFKNIYDGIYYEAQKAKEHYLDNIDNYASILLNMLTRFDDLKFYEIDEKYKAPLIEICLSFIDSHYSEDINLDDLAEKLNVSKYYLCHVFLKETGKTIFSYKINKQIEEAKNLLEITDMIIADIASLLGFSNSSYFIKTFKKEVNMTPSQYRLKMKGK